MANKPHLRCLHSRQAPPLPIRQRCHSHSQTAAYPDPMDIEVAHALTFFSMYRNKQVEYLYETGETSPDAFELPVKNICPRLSCNEQYNS